MSSKKNGNGGGTSTRAGNEHPADALRRFKEEAAAHLETLETQRQMLAERIESDTRELAEVDASLKEIRRLVEGPKKRAGGGRRKKKQEGEEQSAEGSEGEELDVSDDEESDEGEELSAGTEAATA